MTSVLKSTMNLPVRAVSVRRSVNFVPIASLDRIPKKSIRPRVPTVAMTAGTFTTATENLHGRIAMCGLTAAYIIEQSTGIPIGQQITSITGQSLMNVGAFVTLVTLGFILYVFNPTTPRRFEEELQVWDKPGFTLETEILHGRIAMLGFTFAFIAEILSKHLML